MWTDPLFAVLSLFRPIVVERTMGLHGPLTVRWERGRKVLNSRSANQSFGSLHRVWQATLEQTIDRTAPPRTALMLGFGGGSAYRILRDELHLATRTTAIELDGEVIALAARHFGQHEGPDLRIIQGNAVITIHGLNERFDLILVDLFDDLDLARGVDTNGFAHALRDRCAEGGMVCFNTVAHDPSSSKRCQRVHDNLAKVFLHVSERVFEGENRVFIAH